jgi:predicted nucleic acid-binding protein
VPRVVADTNIYISALNFSGVADDALALGRAGALDIYISPAIGGLRRVSGRRSERSMTSQSSFIRRGR